MVKLSAAQIAGVVKYESVGAGASFANFLYKDSDGPIFVAIALAESDGETTATHRNNNGSTDYGLWQINSIHKDLLAQNQPWSAPKNNYYMAHELYASKQGKFTDWTTFTAGLYAAHLPAATTAWNNPDDSATQPNAIHDAANTGGEVVQAGLSVADFIGTLTKSETWVRIGMGAAGVVLVLVVVAALMRNHLPGPLGAITRVAKASKAVPAGVTEGIPA
jgi:hypothetical protein